MARIDLNADLGEGAAFDEDLMPLITSANIACGFHAGSPHLMQQSVGLCVKYGVRIGAHPSFPDFWGFGRRAMHCSAREVKDYVLYQIGALAAFCRAGGVELQHVKPHGALYNMAAKDIKLAEAICEAVASFDDRLYIFAQPNSALSIAAQRFGLSVAYEAFADRAYNSDGTLVSRSHPGAVLHDEKAVTKRTVTMVLEQRVETIDGQTIELQPQTICLHGDNPAAVALAQGVRQALEASGVRITAVSSR